MNAGTHTIGAAAAGAACYAFYSMPFQLESIYGAIFIGSTIAGGLLPDICQPFSWIGRRLGLISKMVNKIFGHRTFTHSLLFLVFLFLASGAVQENWAAPFQYGLTIGAASHLLLDMLTPRGVALLYPAKFYIKAPLTTKTGSIMGEGVIGFLMMAWIVYFSTTMTG
ncbi:metal-dependent hydrolase [Alteribacillus sp. YIM 98480]|uniref:metal-dependent hydrolase n=1 Tax=Alteribacillus sp. YIM 98480 TaxID=2606599 RepID=UPI00131C7D25|nr:metal-dependent hydrolase [Alteribacillus sp. YIM 98480]